MVSLIQFCYAKGVKHFLSCMDPVVQDICLILVIYRPCSFITFVKLEYTFDFFDDNSITLFYQFGVFKEKMCITSHIIHTTIMTYNTIEIF